MLNDAGLDLLFYSARTHSSWQPRSVDPALLEKLYDLLKWGPTSANSSPLRLLFITSPAAKERLKPALSEGNIAKTMAAPVTAILGYALDFYEKLPQLFPHADARSWFADNPSLIEETAFRNSALQGGYFILAARSLGLDCGPMSGFNATQINQTFFPDGKTKVNFICNLGYGDPQSLHPRNPRLTFHEACQIL